MDIRNSMEGLRTLLGVNQAAPATSETKSHQPVPGGAFANDLATVSSAGSEVSQAASGEGIRMDKVAAVQAALSAGTYSVPASAVASKVVDTMLGKGQ